MGRGKALYPYRLEVRMSEADRRWLAALSEQTGRTASDLVRQAVAEWRPTLGSLKR